MNRDSLLETLRYNKAKLTFEDIKEIMDEELNKEPEEMDTDLIDLCMDALEEAMNKPEEVANEEINETTKKNNRKVIRFTRALLIAAIVVVFFSIAIPVSAEYIKSNKIDVPDNIIDSSLYGAVQKTFKNEFSATLGISHTEWIDVEFKWSISNGSVHIDTDRDALANQVELFSIEGDPSEVILVYTEYLGGGGSYSPEYYDYYFYICNLEKNKIIPLFDKPLNWYRYFDSVQIAPDHSGVVFRVSSTDTFDDTYYFNGEKLINIAELLGIKTNYAGTEIGAYIYDNYIVVIADDHSNFYAPKQSYYFIDLTDMNVINGASDIPRYLPYHQPNGITPCGGIFAYRYNEEGKIEIVDIRDASVKTTEAKGTRDTEASVDFYNGHLLYFDKEGTVQIIDLEKGELINTIKTGFDFSGKWGHNLSDNEDVCYLFITTKDNETYSYTLDWNVSSSLLTKNKNKLFDRTVQGTWYKDGKFYEFHNGALQEAKVNNFSASLKTNGEKYQIDFIWSVTNDVLRYACYQNNLPSGFSLKEIEGCNTALLLSHSLGNNSYEYFICNVENNTVAPLFKDVLSKYAVNDITVSSDLKKIVFNANNGKDGYYYDGKKIYNIYDLFKKEFKEKLNDRKEELVRFVKIKGTFAGKYIVVYFEFAFNSEEYNLSGEQYTYGSINTENMSVFQPLGFFEKYEGYTIDPIYCGGLYAARPEYNGLMPVCLYEEQEDWDSIEMAFTPEQNYSEYFNGFLVFYGEEGLVQIFDPAKKEVVSTIKTGIAFNTLTKQRTRIVEDGNGAYLLIPTGTESFDVFKLTLPK